MLKFRILLMAAIFLIPPLVQSQEGWNITQLSRLEYPHAYTVDVSDGYAYLVSGTEGLKILDVSDPFAPVEIGAFPATDWAYDVAVNGSLAYFSSGYYLHVLDITDPQNPVEVNTNWELGDAREFTLAGDYAYAFVSMSNAVAIIDISDPVDPTIVNYFNPGGWGAGMALSGNYLYVPQCLGGFSVVDISDPPNPNQVGFFPLTEGSGGAAFYNDRVLVPHGTGGVMTLKIINVEDPTAPYWEFDCPVDEIIGHIEIVGDQLYGSDIAGALRIFNIEDLTNPIQIGYHLTEDFVTEIVISGQYAYTAESTALGIYDCSEAQPVGRSGPRLNLKHALLHVYPNPFNPATMLTYQLPIAGYAELVIFDVFGRNVSILAAGWHQAGNHQFTFDGSALASGVYFYKFGAANNIKSGKLLLLK